MNRFANSLLADAGALTLFNAAVGNVDEIRSDTPFTVHLTRDAAGLVSGYVNGNRRFTHDDDAGAFTATSGLWFLRDDLRQNYEDSAGSADYIRVYDTVEAVTSTPTGAVPEPATWAMMLMGFGAMGAGLRHRPRQERRVRFAA